MIQRMFANRAVLLGAIVLCATGLVGATGLFRAGDKPASPVGSAKAAAAPVAPVAKQTPAQDPRCAFQDKDDDEKEGKIKKTKPDTDDEELECGDQNDDDGGVNEDNDREHSDHAKKASEKKADVRQTGTATSAGKVSK